MKPKSPQLDLLSCGTYKIRFGGSLLKNSHPKEKRELPRKRPIHVVLKSTKATGDWNLLKFNRKIESIVRESALKQHIKFRRLANSGNHLHIIIELRRKESFNPFIKSITSWITREVTGAYKGTPLTRELNTSKSSAFWTSRPFTRIGSYGTDYYNQIRYLNLNKLEVATGLKRESARILLSRLERSDQVFAATG